MYRKDYKDVNRYIFSAVLLMMGYFSPFIRLKMLTINSSINRPIDK